MSEMELRITDALYINKRLQPKDDGLPVIVTKADTVIWFSHENESVSIAIDIQEMRAIMRLFDMGATGQTP